MYDKDKHIEELETVNSALSDKLSFLKKRQMARNDKAANEWRTRAFYLKRKVKVMARFIKDNGLDVPKINEKGGANESTN